MIYYTLEILHFLAEPFVFLVNLQHIAAGTCSLLSVIFSVCPLDGKHAPPQDAQRLNSQSLTAVLKCPATRCTQPQHLNEEAAQFKRCRLTDRERSERHTERMWRAVSSNDAD